MWKTWIAVGLVLGGLGCSGAPSEIRADDVQQQGAAPALCGVWCPMSTPDHPEYFCPLPDGGGYELPDGGLNLETIPGACRLSTTECSDGEVRCDGNPPTAICCKTSAPAQ